jgi:hypothetical protein
MLFSESPEYSFQSQREKIQFIAHDHSLQVYYVGRWSYWEVEAKFSALHLCLRMVS